MLSLVSTTRFDKLVKNCKIYFWHYNYKKDFIWVFAIYLINWGLLEIYLLPCVRKPCAGKKV